MADFMMDTARFWYVLRVRPRHEKAAAERLSKEYETYLPLIEQRRKWSDRMKTIETPLFSGYLFIRTDIRMKYFILADPAVSHFVRFGSKEAVIREAQIEYIRRMLAEPATLKVEEGLHFEKGENVTVLRGAFAGLQGQVQQIKNKTRLYILIEPLGKRLSVEIDADALTLSKR
jgi:transcription antitermination factor NusG